MVWLAINLLIVHLVITKVGLIFVDAEILRIGNEQLLDNFEEGVLILEEEKMEPIFLNKAARELNFDYSDSIPDSLQESERKDIYNAGENSRLK